MAYINLLPWREEAQKAKQKEFFMALGAVAMVAVAVSLLVGQFYQMRLDGQLSKNQYLINEIQKLDIQIAEIKGYNEQKAKLENRIAVVQQLQRSRNVGTQVLDEITKIVPNGIYLTSLDKQSNVIELIGKSESNNNLANMIREIESSTLLADAQLSTISSKDTNSKLLSDFTMTVRIQGLVSDIELTKAVTKGGK